jgi:hypothetical protein
MELTNILEGMGGLRSMAGELGVSEGEARQGAEALLPAILGGFKKQAQGLPAGAEGLGGLLGQLGGGELLDQVLGPHSAEVSHGNQVLEQIFGSRDTSRAVAQGAATQTGLDPSLLRKMLPLLAMMVAGFMAKQPGGSPAAGSNWMERTDVTGLMGSLIGIRSDAGRGPPPGDLASLLDMNGDGNALDDILRIAGKLR